MKILRKRSESKPFNIKSLVSSSCIITVKIDLSQQKGNPHQTPADFVDIADGYLSMPSREQAPEKYFSGRGVPYLNTVPYEEFKVGSRSMLPRFGLAAHVVFLASFREFLSTVSFDVPALLASPGTHSSQHPWVLPW